LERLYRVEAPHFHAGLVVRDGRIAEAAPELEWAMGWLWIDVLVACVEKGWLMNLQLPEAEPAWLKAKRLMEG
jgi:hypothetical protein